MDEKTEMGFWVVLAGLLAVLAVYTIGVWKYSSAADASAAIGAVTGAIGAIVGAFFGIQAGAAGKDKAENARTEAESKLNRLLLAEKLPPNEAQLIFKELAKP